LCESEVVSMISAGATVKTDLGKYVSALVST
jgi:hypothetical protein